MGEIIMSPRQRHNDTQTINADDQHDPLHPLLQKRANAFDSGAHIHGAFFVDAHEQEIFTVSHREYGRQYHVKRAASCLLLPEPGDKVLVSGDGEGGLYIIAVLEQRANGRTTVQVNGVLALSADEISLAANHSLALKAESFNLTADVAAVDAKDWAVKSDHHTVTSIDLDVVALTSTYRGNQRESYYRSVTDTTGQSTRYVTGTDKVKAINIDYAADFITRLSGDTTIVNGETVVKADGKQILVG